MELNLSFLKNCINLSNNTLSVKSSRKSNRNHSKGSFTCRNPQKKLTSFSQSRLCPRPPPSILLGDASTPCLNKPSPQKLSPKRITINPTDHFEKTSNSTCVRFSKLLAGFKSDIEITPPRTRTNSFTSTQAKHRIKDYNTRSWMSKHNARNNDEGFLMKFATEFFSEMDKDKLGAISGKALIESLLSLGIATDSDVLSETLSMIFRSDDLNKLQITQQNFLSMFRSEVITDLILTQLNESSLAERKKIKVLSQRHIRNRSAIDTHKPLAVFKARLAASISGVEFITDDKNAQNMITINEHLAVTEKLWNKYYKIGEDGISILTICEIFKYFKIFQDNFECKKYVISMLGQVQMLGFKDFQQLFARSMLKGAFVNLSKRLFEGNYAEKEMSSGFKISSYQRALLMSGVKCPNSNISIDEGHRIVTALEKFKNFPKTTYEELRKKLLAIQGKSEQQTERDFLKIIKDRKVINEIKKISKIVFIRKPVENSQKRESIVKEKPLSFLNLLKAWDQK